jgi:hypothetical protein
MLTRPARAIGGGVLLLLGTMTWSQCSSAAPPEATSTTPALLGQMTPVVSTRELMSGMIDPVSDYIFDAVRWESGPEGVVEYRPKTDEDWEKIRIGAVTIAEGITLLKVPREPTPPGDVNNSTGPNPPELSPTQIKEKIAKDPVLWDAKIQATRNAALEVLEIVKKRDADALFEAGGDLDEACEACHLEYWYPGDKPAVDEWKGAKVTVTKPATKK